MANGRIKGITVEIGGDTRGLTDALKDVNKESAKVTSELKEVERALKFDPGNTELIAQKQQLLAEQIQNTSQKLDVLKEAQSQVEAQFQRGDIGAEQYRAFQRELATTEAQLRQYQNQMDATAANQDRLARTTGELSAFFQATGTEVNQFADVLGTRLTNAIRDGSATSDQMNRALRLMGQHALGAGADIDQMRQALRRASEGANLDEVRQDLARITQEANQAEDAVNGFGQELSGVVAGLAAGGGIAGVLNQALDVTSLNTKIEISMNLNEEDTKAVRQSIMETTAAIGDEEAAYEGVRRQIALNKDASMETNQAIIQSASMIAMAYKEIDFKELIQESYEIGKEMNISQQEALALTNQLLSIGFPPEQLDIIAEYGAQLTRAGFSATEVQAIMAAGVDTGTWNIDNLLDGLKEGRIKAAEFGQGLDKATRQAIDGTDLSITKLEELGQAIASGGEKGSAAFVELTKYLAGIEDQTKRNEIGVLLFGTMFEDQGENVVNSVLNMVDHMATADEMQQKLNADVEKMQSDPAYRLAEAMGNIKETLAPLLAGIAEFVAKIAEWVSNNAELTAAIVAIVASIGILVGLFVALMPAIGGLVTAWPALVAAIGTISAPIALVVAAIAGIGIALVAAYQNSETFRENVQVVFSKIKEIAVTVFEAVASFIGEKIAQIKQFWDQNGQQILKAVENVFNGIKAVIEFVMPAVKLVVETVWNAIKQVIDGALNVIMGAIKTFSGLFTGDFSKMWEGVKQIFKGAIDLVVGWMTLSFFGGIKTIVTNLAKTGVSLLKGMWDDIAKFFTSMGSKVSSTVSSFSTSVLNFFKNLATNAGSTISNMVTSVINFVKNLATNFVNTVSTMRTNVVNKMTEIKDGMIDKVKSLPAQFIGIGKDIINGLIKGISAMTANVLESITGVVDGVVNKAKNLLGIKSPSRVFKQIGQWTSEGWAIGIEEKSSMVKNAVSDIALTAQDIAEHYVNEEKKLRSGANSEIAKIEKDKVTEIAKIEKRMHEDVTKIQRAASSKKKKTTQDDALKIQRIKEDAAAKILKLETSSDEKIKSLKSKSTKEIIDLESKMNKDLLEETKRYIDDKKSLDQLSLIEEAQIWEQSMKLFAEGTQERIKAQQEYKKATEAVSKEITAINTDFSNQIQKINDDLIKQEETLTKAYSDAVDKRAQSLVSFKGLFDEFKVEMDVTGEQLIANLFSQVDGFKLWQKEIEKISGRAIDKGLLEELRQMGPNALPELVALNQLTDSQLQQYSNLYKEKSKLARTQAETELKGMKDDTDKQIKALRDVANKQLTTLESEWNAKIKSLTNATSTELSSLEQIGKDAGNGLLNGLSSTSESIRKKALEIAESVSKTISGALKIKSPSRVTMGFGVNINEGLIKGIEQSQNKLQNAMNSVYGSLASSANKSQANQIAQQQQVINQSSNTDLSGLIAAIVQLASRPVEASLFVDGQPMATTMTPYITNIMGNNFNSELRRNGVK